MPKQGCLENLQPARLKAEYSAQVVFQQKVLKIIQQYNSLFPLCQEVLEIYSTNLLREEQKGKHIAKHVALLYNLMQQFLVLKQQQ